MGNKDTVQWPNIFYRFLKDNDIYSSYLYYCRKYFSQNDEKNVYYLCASRPSYALSSFFSWSETKEGFDFWDNKHKLWNVYIKKIDL